MPWTARPRPMGGVSSPTTSPLSCHIVTSGTTFESEGGLGHAGLTQASFGTTLTLPHTQYSLLVVGVGWHPAEQCSAVESSKSQGPVGDLNNQRIWGHFVPQRESLVHKSVCAIVPLFPTMSNQYAPPSHKYVVQTSMSTIPYITKKSAMAMALIFLVNMKMHQHCHSSKSRGPVGDLNNQRIWGHFVPQRESLVHKSVCTIVPLFPTMSNQYAPPSHKYVVQTSMSTIPFITKKSAMAMALIFLVNMKIHQHCHCYCWDLHI